MTDTVVAEQEEIPNVVPRTRDADEREDERPDLDAIADETQRRIAARAILSYDRIGEVMRSKSPEAAGVNGWAAKIGDVKGKGGKTLPGMRLCGQIVACYSVRGRFGVQQVVVVNGSYSCPSYANGNGEVVPAVADEKGRRLLAVDSALSDLPNRVGQVVDIQCRRRGGGGKRHEYHLVNAYPVGD